MAQRRDSRKDKKDVGEICLMARNGCSVKKIPENVRFLAEISGFGVVKIDYFGYIWERYAIELR